MIAEPIPKEAAERIVEILTKHDMMPDSEREAWTFVQRAVEGGITEWRLPMFSAKFWNMHGEWYVARYQECRTPERNELEKKVNQELAELYREFH